MIPYDELVAALASWRQRQGLPAGPADYLGEPVRAGYDYAPAASGGGYGDDVVELSDEMMDSVVEEQSSPYSVEAVEMVDDGMQGLGSDTQDEGYDPYGEAMAPEPPKPEPEPEPQPSGRRKRKK